MNSACTRYILWIIATCGAWINGIGQGTVPNSSVWYQVTGGNSLVNEGQDAMYGNPAGLLLMDQALFGSLSGSNRYGTDIRSASGTLNFKSNNQAFGLSLNTYGIEGFRQNQFSLAYARQLSGTTRLGLTSHWYSLNIAESTNQSELDLTLGIQQDIGEEWSIGAYLINPLTRDNMNMDYSGVTISSAGVLSQFLTIYVSGHIPFSGIASLQPGIMYDITDFLTAYVSIATSPSTYNYGIDIGITDEWNIAIALNTHPQLGNSLFFTTGYKFN